MAASMLNFQPVLTLSLDSLIAAAALAPVVAPRHYMPLALLFGACDLAASSVASIADAAFLAPCSAVPWVLLSGFVVLSGSAAPAQRRKLTAAAYLLPPCFALDNLIAPASPILAGLSSCAMATVGFALGAAVLERLAPAAARPLWAAGLAVIAIALQLAQ